jgi:hypothetical protein
MGNSDESIAWGVVMITWIVFGFGPMLAASADEEAGVKGAATRVDALSKSLPSGFYVLVGCWALSWSVIPSVLISLLVSGVILIFRSTTRKPDL